MDRSITITDFDDYRIFQRIPGQDTGSIAITGVCVGFPALIQARVLNYNDHSEVLTWTTLTSTTITDAAFSGTLENIPCGGWYKLEVRDGDATTITDLSHMHFGTGVLIAIAGQSNADRLFQTFGGVCADTPHELTKKYVHNSGWCVNTGFGAIAFANKLRQELNIPVGLLDCGLDSSALIYPNMPNNGYWSRYTENPYLNFNNSLNAVDNKIEFFVWLQGESDAMGQQTTAAYKTALKNLFNQVKSDSCNSVKFMVATLARFTYTADLSNIGRSIADIRQAQLDVCNEETDVFPAATLMDQSVTYAGAHWSMIKEAASTGMLRTANTILYTLGKVSYYRGPRFMSFNVISSTELHVKLQHNGGTDFSGDVDWFMVDGLYNNVSATKIDANTIKVIGTGFSNRTILGYQDSGSLQSTTCDSSSVKNIAKDNSAMQLPIEHIKSIPLNS